MSLGRAATTCRSNASSIGCGENGFRDRSAYETKTKKNTKAEDAYLRDVKRTSTFEKADRGEAQLLSPDEYPEPVKRFLARERQMLHIKLSAASKRKLNAVSRAKGTPMEQLARKWVEERLTREAG